MDDIDYSIYYARFHNDTEEHAEVMARQMEGILRPSAPSDLNAAILDIGCGYGFALRALRHLGYKNLSGVEQSGQQAERCHKAGFDVAVTEDTIQWLEAKTGRFDYVVLLDVLEHVPVAFQISLLRAIYKVLRPGGKLLLTVPNANAILSARWRYNDYTHHSSFTEHSLFFVLKNAGFDGIDMDSSKGIHRFPKRFWRRDFRATVRKLIVRWCWLQVFKAEIPWENQGLISFELNLKAVATKT